MLFDFPFYFTMQGGNQTLFRAMPTATGFVRGWRGVSGVRRLLGNFIRTVHPDLSPEFPPEARRINQRSLAELNAFVDFLESDEVRKFEEGPEAAHELPFFRALQTRLGRVVPNRVTPIHLQLPSLPASADHFEKEFAAAHLIRGAQVALEPWPFQQLFHMCTNLDSLIVNDRDNNIRTLRIIMLIFDVISLDLCSNWCQFQTHWDETQEASPSSFSERPDVSPLFTQKGAGRAAFDKLWWQQTQEELVREAIHGPDDQEVKLHVAKRVFACKYAHQLMRRYVRIKNTAKRKRRLAGLEEIVQAKIEKKFPSTPEREYEMAEKKDPVRVLQGGFHPDLVFMAAGLSDHHRREAIKRVCGMNLKQDSDFWLLENLWKAMRGTPPAVPLVIAERDYKAHENGFIQIPWDFTVLGLCDLLEEHLDTTRENLRSRREQYRTPPAPPLEVDEGKPCFVCPGMSIS